ncbi:MAG: formate dehydrogenase [Betaproteobacteria bacterium]|jgi:formate dehydrogenase subunit delta|nr:formate dehydrogenase [Betaproteobacteria bacterium]
MDIHNLVHMANQIGEFFSAYPDRDEALEGIANHIRKFWEPRMRLKLFESIDQGLTGELSELVAQSLALHRTSLQPTAMR